MFKVIHVCQCDICGKVENAKFTSNDRDEISYTLPNGWKHGYNKDMHYCQDCAIKLSSSLMQCLQPQVKVEFKDG